METRVAQITRELDQEKIRSCRLQTDITQLATDYEKAKEELCSSKEQRNELVQLARTQADKIVALEDDNLYQHSSTIIGENHLKTDLMKDLDEKYRELQARYNRLGKGPEILTTVVGQNNEIK